ncbi:hypothetical protein L1887_05382 [Cichorium endivia]|nr:hypothetical protein L1887_05382 [Cichorium endivia]
MTMLQSIGVPQPEFSPHSKPSRLSHSVSSSNANTTKNHHLPPLSLCRTTRFFLSLSLSNPNCPFSSFQLLPTIRRLISLHVSITIIFLHHRLSLLPHEIDFYKISFLGFSTHTYTLSKFLPKTRYRRKFFSSTSELPLCGFSTIKGFVMN